MLAAGCEPEATAAPVPDAESVSRSMEVLARTVGPSVVHIEATGFVTRRDGAVGLVGRARSSGSGVVIDADGWIVTNAHVVYGAERIAVTVVGAEEAKPNRRRLTAKLVGVDLDSDIAVLKIDAKGLVALPTGDSNAVRPGQLVMAFGSPLGLQGSVTIGIVGAVDRQPDPDDPMVYLQTDAAINPGNSGGALVDTSGRLIGLNTFIVSTTGGNQGLGFAVPIDIAMDVYRQIRKDGAVWHGVIGVHAQSVTPLLADDLGLSQTWGALVADVHPEGPADAAEIKPGDIVVTFEGDRIETARELNARIHATRPGTIVTLEIARDGKVSEAAIQVAARPGDPAMLVGKVDPRTHAVDALQILGLEVGDSVRVSMPGLRSTAGVLVIDVADVPATQDDLQPGDVIVAVGRQTITDLAGLRKAVAPYSSGTLISVRIERGGVFRWIRLEVP